MKSIILYIAAMVIGILPNSKPEVLNSHKNYENETVLNNSSFSNNAIIRDYLKIKNALVKDNTKAAALASLDLEVTLDDSENMDFPVAQRNTFLKLSSEAKKFTRSIRVNNGKIDRQRKSFKELSTIIAEEVKTFGNSQKLYYNYCPMHERGSYWLSEIKEVKNPYYGAQMLGCGKVTQEIK